MRQLHRSWTPSWEVFNHFPQLRETGQHGWKASWAGTIEWVAQVRKDASDEVDAIRPLLKSWDAALPALGGDPTRQDWEHFRPLRLSREEDWSDWLAFLLRAREGHCIAYRLFPATQLSTTVEDVKREVAVLSGRRRADLVLLWSGNTASSVEVKVWDQSFEKTAETSSGCRLHFSTRSEWHDYILLPDESGEAFAGSSVRNTFTVVTWSDVARELRRALLIPECSWQWLAFARAFCGAVEQKILGISGLASDRSDRFDSAVVFRFGRIVREALNGTHR